jgi:hypothetical protein
MEGKKLALAVRHVHFEDCGTLEDVLVERGFTVRYLLEVCYRGDL